MRLLANVVLSATGLLLALTSGCAVGQIDEEDVPIAADTRVEVSVGVDVANTEAAVRDGGAGDSRVDVAFSSDVPVVRDSVADAPRPDGMVTSDVPMSMDVPTVMDVPAPIDIPTPIDIPAPIDVPPPMDTFVPPDEPMTVDVPVFPIDTRGGGGPGALCTVDSQCNAGGANCCANISGLQVCGCRVFGTCNPIFCM